MPLCRYQIRNEFGLADRELYDAADKDDPEALLEGFAMAALVGALRQLGDLAEFAAGIFSDLHDEVAATVARSHGVMIRVQHLEMELPLLEKMFLKQTNHSSFFYTAGIDWHPNMRTDENCITKGDLPRFITDSYEETRAPPSFTFLDRFDAGGDGACLRRYTNPSFYKVEAAALGTTKSDVHGENGSRKGKRRGTLWRNGRTLKALPTSHAKLHQLLLEESIENNVSDPARHVKLKRRLNGFPFDLKTGKSYMEKILKDHSPDHVLLERVSIGSVVGSVPCDLDAEVERQFNGSESPDRQLTSRYPSQKPELKNVVSYHILGANNLLSNLHEDVDDKKIIVDSESNAKATMFSYQSDDDTSEVEIHIDKLASEPQIYSDPKLVTKTDFHVSSNRKQVPGLDVTKSLTQAQFPDSQSVGSSTLSDDRISSLKKCICTSSCSHGLSEIARSIHLEAEVPNAYPIIIEAKSPYRQLKWRGCAECNTMADNFALSSDNTGQSVSNVISAQRDKDSTLYDHGVVKVQKRGMGSQDLPGTEPSNVSENEIKLEQNMPFNSNTSITHSGERGPVYFGSILGVNLSEADVKRDETELNQCEMETGVSEAGDGKLLVKSHLKQRENSNDLDQEEYHVISPLSFLENLKNQRSPFDLLTQEKATLTGVGTPNVSLGSISPVLNVLPEAVKINQEEVPPPPPLPPVQGRMGRNQPISLTHVSKALSDNKGPSLSQSMTNQNTPHHASLGKDLPLVHEATSGNSVHDDPLSSFVHVKENHPLPSLGKIESITQKLPLPANLEVSQLDDHDGPYSVITLLGTTADVTAAGDTGQTHDLAAMNQQKGARLRNPLIDSIAAHDKTKLKKVTEQAGSKVHISDGRDSLLEQIRAKAFNLKPTKVQRRNIQGPATNLRVAAILEKAKTIRHAFSGSDEDNDDSWSD